jgi:hypothetical protein
VKNAAGRDAIFKAMDDLDLDVISAPIDGPISTLAAMAGRSTII